METRVLVIMPLMNVPRIDNEVNFAKMLWDFIGLIFDCTLAAIDPAVIPIVVNPISTGTEVKSVNVKPVNIIKNFILLFRYSLYIWGV